MIFLLIIFSFIAHAEPLRISSVEVEPHKHYDNFFIKTNSYLIPKAKLLDNRLVLDFKGVEVKKPQKIEVPKSDRVRSVRIGQFSRDPLIARVVFDLKRNIKFECALLYGRGRIMVEVADSEESIPAMAVRPETDHNYVPKTNIEVKAKSPKFPSKAIIVSGKKDKSMALRGKVIVVDPGHGGDDPGATGPGGILEKQINLKVAFYLVDYLKRKGASVFITRKTDIKKELKDITEFANRIGADAYVGVHFNSIDNPKIRGTETHYYTPQSLKLAKKIHDNLLNGIRREDRGLKRTMLYTIHHARMPAIIVEPVYMTHFQDGLLIKSKSFQKEVARDIARGVVEYFNAD